MDTKNFKELESAIKKERQIAIYGAGVVAQNAYLLFKHYFKKPFWGFIVSNYDETDSKCRMTKEMYGEKIYSVENPEILSDDKFIIIATSPKYCEQIKKILDEKKIQKYCFLSAEIRQYFFEELYKRFFKNKQIDINGKYVEIFGKRNVVFKNPFFEESRNRNSCFSELGTILLPGCYDLTLLSSETPYEYDCVTLDEFEKGIVFDLGANQGYFSLLAASAGHRVYAFEPSKGVLKTLKEYEEMSGGKIQIVEAAVSDKIGTADFNIDEFSDDANSLVLKTNANSIYQVNTITLDQFVEDNAIEKVDFIKADIEGAERDMLRGAKKVLKKYKPLLSICTYHLPDDPNVIKNIIKEANPEYKIIQKEKKIYAY